jgi:hypothetical protein
MAEEKKRKKTKKAPDEEKTAGQGEAAPEEKVTEEAVAKTEETGADATAGEGGKAVGEEPESPADEEKAAGEVEAAPEEKVTEETVEKVEETEPDATARDEGKEIGKEPESPADEEKAAPTITESDLKKPLEKMTAKELREVAVGIPGISGVHALKKEELLTAIREAWGIKEEKAPKKEKKGKAAVSVADLKAKIQAIKAKRAEAIQKKDKRMATIYRRMINRLKKRTRRAA